MRMIIAEGEVPAEGAEQEVEQEAAEPEQEVEDPAAAEPPAEGTLKCGVLFLMLLMIINFL